MPYVKIWIHAVWATKNREPFLNKNIRSLVFEHIHQYGLSKNILIDCVNGHHEHVHCLFRLRNDQNLSKVLQLLKGESSFWINNQNLIKPKFIWQKEYFAVSVSESVVDTVRRYIHNQEEHHSKKPFAREYDEFITKYNFQVINDYV
ncbi:MAG: IS200/IS605 family transposase [Bacteroidales bacterium]|nr:IS200/IS605 family transposase [Bacteroidales bacterium]